MIDAALHKELITALAWYVDNGVNDIMLDEVIDRTNMPNMPVSGVIAPAVINPPQNPLPNAASYNPTQILLGKSDARVQAVNIVRAVSSLDELCKSIAAFDGIAIKKTATNMVFADGNPNANIMVIGDAPDADGDRCGIPFVGADGRLLDKILACVGLSRAGDTPENSVYITNILNWRPPGNRTPSPSEIEVSLPFIERHIQLVQPKIIVLCGVIAAKALLGRTESISRLRKTWHNYVPISEELSQGSTIIPALATYPPSYLIASPLQKKAVWMDMIELKEKINSL